MPFSSIGTKAGWITPLGFRRTFVVKSYQRDLEQFLSWLTENGTSAPDKINQHLVRAWVASRHRQSISGKSLQRQLSSLRTFFRYLLREGVMTHNPAEGVRAPKAKRPLPKALDADQLSHLLDRQAADPLEKRELLRVSGREILCGLEIEAMLRRRLKEGVG